MSLDTILQTALGAGGVMGFILLLLRLGSGDHPVWIFSKVRDDERAMARERLDELRSDRDGWRKLAETSTETVAKLTEQVESLTGSVETFVASAARNRR